MAFFSPAFGQQIRDVDMIENRDRLLRFRALRQNRLDVLPVDLDVPPAPRRVPAVGVLQDHQTPALQILRHAVETAGNRKEQVLPHDPAGIFPRVIHIVFRRMPFGNVRVQRVDSGGKTAASCDIRFLGDQHPDSPALSQPDRRIASGRSASDDQHIGRQQFLRPFGHDRPFLPLISESAAPRLRPRKTASEESVLSSSEEAGRGRFRRPPR